MTKQEMAKILTYLMADFDKEVTEGKVLVWFDQFSHIDQQTAWIAARLMMSRKVYAAPKAHEFSDVLKEVLHGEARLGAEAFQMAVEAARRFGFYQQQSAFKWLPDDVREAVEKFGFRDICYAESNELIRGPFIRLFESLQEQNRKTCITSPSLIRLAKSARLNLTNGSQPIGDVLKLITTNEV